MEAKLMPGIPGYFLIDPGILRAEPVQQGTHVGVLRNQG
jgi:hypothetical protein